MAVVILHAHKYGKKEKSKKEKEKVSKKVRKEKSITYSESACL